MACSTAELVVGDVPFVVSVSEAGDWRGKTQTRARTQKQTAILRNPRGATATFIDCCIAVVCNGIGDERKNYSRQPRICGLQFAGLTIGLTIGLAIFWSTKKNRKMPARFVAKQPTGEF